MTLHLYDHCPYCVRVELALGLKGLPFERKVYGYGDNLGDDSKGKYYGGSTLTGKKMLPVLEISGRNPKYMGESSIIIAYLEGISADTGTPQLIPPSPVRKDLATFFASDGEFKRLQRILTRPLVIRMKHLKDWQKDEDVAYAIEKYEKAGFDYEDAERRRPEAAKRMEKLLVELEAMMQSDISMTGRGKSWDDVFTLPELRTLSCAPDLRWPNKLRKYLDDSLKRCGVGSYFA